MPQLTNPVFVIEPVVRRYRYMFTGGKIMDVDSPYRADSNDRGLVLQEAQRRWGGKKDDWRIEGVTEVKERAEGVRRRKDDQPDEAAGE